MCISQATVYLYHNLANNSLPAGHLGCILLVTAGKKAMKSLMCVDFAFLLNQFPWGQFSGTQYWVKGDELFFMTLVNDY